MYIHIYTYIFAYVYLCIYIYFHAYTYVYIYIYSHVYGASYIFTSHAAFPFDMIYLYVTFLVRQKAVRSKWIHTCTHTHTYMHKYKYINIHSCPQVTRQRQTHT